MILRLFVVRCSTKRDKLLKFTYFLFILRVDKKHVHDENHLNMFEKKNLKTKHAYMRNSEIFLKCFYRCVCHGL